MQRWRCYYHCFLPSFLQACDLGISASLLSTCTALPPQYSCISSHVNLKTFLSYSPFLLSLHAGTQHCLSFPFGSEITQSLEPSENNAPGYIIMESMFYFHWKQLLSLLLLTSFYVVSPAFIISYTSSPFCCISSSPPQKNYTRVGQYLPYFLPALAPPQCFSLTFRTVPQHNIPLSIGLHFLCEED